MKIKNFYEKYWKKISIVSLIWAVLSLATHPPENNMIFSELLGYLGGRFIASFVIFFLVSSLVGYVYLSIKKWHDKK
ncbi:hypothetical protein HZA97_07855 [Candidatus Woesearchaeota archaeon]|nr:hypothetical protein [Candidatus Woesearchaeota archaeon]